MFSEIIFMRSYLTPLEDEYEYGKNSHNGYEKVPVAVADFVFSFFPGEKEVNRGKDGSNQSVKNRFRLKPAFINKPDAPEKKNDGYGTVGEIEFFFVIVMVEGRNSNPNKTDDSQIVEAVIKSRDNRGDENYIAPSGRVLG